MNIDCPNTGKTCAGMNGPGKQVIGGWNLLVTFPDDHVNTARAFETSE